MGKREMILPAKVNVRALAAVSKFVSNEETRYYLNGVLVEVEPRAVTYVATDGHTLLVHRREKMSDRDIEPDNDMTGDFIIPTAQCRALKVGKKEIGDADLYGDRDELTLKLGERGIVFKPIDGDFPHWRLAIPKMPLTQGIGQFNGHYVERFVKASEELSLGLMPFFAHNGQSNPALVRFPADPNTIGIIMPFKADDLRMKPLPAWIEAPRAAAE